MTILCHTYNHASYIAGALNGFLMQRTTFPFEVIVHDDASTDGTTEIVRSYCARFPRVVRAVIQERNIYSRGLKPISFTLPQSQGDYIALCEGDDFWIEPDKLQKQVDAIEARPDCDMAYHRAIRWVLADARKNCLFSPDHSTRLRDHIAAQRVVRGGGNFCATSSLLLRKSAIAELPPWFAAAPAGDVFLQFLGARRGGALYLHEIMSVCRKGVAGSFTEQIRRPEAHLEHLRRSSETYAAAKAWAGPRWAAAFNARIAYNRVKMLRIALRQGDLAGIARHAIAAGRSSPGMLMSRIGRTLRRRLGRLLPTR